MKVGEITSPHLDLAEDSNQKLNYLPFPPMNNLENHGQWSQQQTVLEVFSGLERFRPWFLRFNSFSGCQIINGERKAAGEQSSLSQQLSHQNGLALPFGLIPAQCIIQRAGRLFPRSIYSDKEGKDGLTFQPSQPNQKICLLVNSPETSHQKKQSNWPKVTF